MIYYSVIKSAPLKKRSAGAFAIISDVANAFLQDYQNAKNRDFQEHMLDRQQQYQNELNANSALVQRQSLERAGLNPNLMTGAPPYGTASALGDSSSQQAPQVDPSAFSVLAQMKQQEPLVNALARKDNAEAEALEIDNRRKMTEDWTYDNEEAMEAWIKAKKKNPDAQMPSLHVTPRNRGWFEAIRNRNLYKSEVQTTEIQGIENSLRKLIVDGQMADPAVLDSFIKLPMAQKNQLVQLANQAIAEAALAGQKKDESEANTNKINAEAAFIKLQEKIQRDNNLVGYVDKIFSGDFSWKDAAKILVLAAIMKMN